VVINAATITPETWRPSSSGSRRARPGAGSALEEAAWLQLYNRRNRRHALRDPEPDPAGSRRQNFQRVGGTTRVHVDVRIISSSSRDLAAEIAVGRFREDLFHRLGVVPIRVPSLSERREDVPELIGFFMDQISAATGLPKRRIAEEAMAVLQSHDWPGNVRQLRKQRRAAADPDQRRP
jgi:two-component system nitrogen regulation response regulator NtrX